MEKIKFSVLMSVYKKENPKYLKDAIDSVYNQTLKPNEVVLVEDGVLTEELEKIIKKYEKENNNFKVIRFQENRGLGLALNDGLKSCKYDYIARMDTDDICRSDRFEIQIKYLIEHNDVDIVGSNMFEYDFEMRNIISKKMVPEFDTDIKKYLKKRNPMNHPTVIFKKKSVLSVNGYENYPYFEDYHLWAKMAKKGYVFYNIQDELYNFRAGSSMIRRRGGKTYLKCIKKIEKELLNLKLINKFEYVFNVTIRYFISLCPTFFRKIIYNLVLRRKNYNEKN